MLRKKLNRLNKQIEHWINGSYAFIETDLNRSGDFHDSLMREHKVCVSHEWECVFILVERTKKLTKKVQLNTRNIYESFEQRLSYMERYFNYIIYVWFILKRVLFFWSTKQNNWEHNAIV